MNWTQKKLLCCCLGSVIYIYIYIGWCYYFFNRSECRNNEATAEYLYLGSDYNCMAMMTHHNRRSPCICNDFADYIRVVNVNVSSSSSSPISHDSAIQNTRERLGQLYMAIGMWWSPDCCWSEIGGCKIETGGN